ncbi:zinc ribbon domain-containing protein [Sulfolobus sp. B1]|nr:zinc ribbon domain-containing protein [Sulfolobus sp. B1]TRM96264.1 zinc ribbon domain-containing protein [Sulfolobus sp. B1]
MRKTFQGVNVNVQQLAQSLAEWFRLKGYISQYYGYGNSYIVQAKKEGLLRHLFAADRAFTVKIIGYPNYLDVDIGVANWVKAEDVTEALIGDLILGPLGLLIEGGEGLWNLEIEHETMKEIERLIKSGLVNMNIQQPYYMP